MRAIGCVAVSVAGLVALTGCGLQDQRVSGAGGSSPSAAPSVAPKAPVPSGKPLGADAHVPSPKGVDATDATAVAKAWAQTAYGYDTKYDTSPHDAVLRSARWFTASKAADERSYHPASGAGDDWNTWADHKAWTTVSVSYDDDGDGPTDTPARAYRALFVDGEAHGRDGWTGTGPRANVYLTLTRSGKGEPWRVSQVTTVEAAVPPSGSPSPSSAASSSSAVTSSAAGASSWSSSSFSTPSSSSFSDQPV
ncbi:hypothetical protein AB5J56_19040 [Streptomyces sp. R21]|uniref:Lipoprotein n=1 Tax=Streptomyces sp. R21 TaxID=3238627 RepID=A0AB39PA81_9ACTN